MTEGCRFARGIIPGSVNIPFNSAFGADGELIASPATEELQSNKFQVKVIVGSRGKNAANVSVRLFIDIHLCTKTGFSERYRISLKVLIFASKRSSNLRKLNQINFMFFSWSENFLMSNDHLF